MHATSHVPMSRAPMLPSQSRPAARFMRGVLIVGGIAVMILAAGYFQQMPWAVATWPWPDGRLSYIFIASIQAAIAAAMIYIGITGAWTGLTAGALNLPRYENLASLVFAFWPVWA